ncbi:hypothetical protein VPH35_004088 [Triticum aestivum]|uniref:uncharacterized protein n=1 Tax=Triticum aestivum TaxID=4565 RepID=UPI001D00FDDB|nr:uncharacterized protein LOC123176623 [Triticum aestivum]
MRMAAGRACGTWSAQRMLLPRQRIDFFRPSPAAVTLRFGDRRAVASRVILCLASGGGRPRDDDGEFEPTDSPLDSDGRMVDEGMDTLWRRIREVEAASADEEDEDEPEYEGGIDVFAPPAEWTELERRHYVMYVAALHEALGALFTLLARERPAFGAAVVALLLLSVSVSVLHVSVELIRAAYSMLAAMHNGTI